MSDQVITGKVCAPLELNKSHSGKEYAAFAVTWKGQPAPCIAWSHMVDDKLWPIFAMLQVGSEVTIKGFWGTRQKKGQKDLFKGQEEEAPKKEFVVKWLSVTGEKSQTVSRAERIEQLLGGKDTADAKWRALVVEMSERGYYYVKVGEGFGWKPKEECIMHRGVRKHRIEYLMDVLGAALVTDELRKAGLSYRAGNIAKYEKKMAELIETARAFEAHPAQV